MLQKKHSNFIIKLTLVLISTNFIISCAVIYNKSKLYLNEKEFNKNVISFRTDGYYYKVKEHEKGNFGISPMIFYENGYVVKLESYYSVSMVRDENEKKKKFNYTLKYIDKRILDNTYHVQIKNTIWDWGLYSQKKDSLIMQTYINYIGDYYLVNWKGVVLNDTTLLVTTRYDYNPKNRKTEIINELYQFRKLNHKPDSINYIMINRAKFGKRRNK